MMEIQRPSALPSSRAARPSDALYDSAETDRRTGPRRLANAQQPRSGDSAAEQIERSAERDENPDVDIEPGSDADHDSAPGGDDSAPRPDETPGPARR